MALAPVLLVAVFLAFGHGLAFAACTDPAAAAATRAAAEEACASLGMGCSTANTHGAYVSCVAQQARAAVHAGTLPKQCKGAVVKCAAKSTCGKPGFVTCCRTTKSGKTSCAITHGAAACKAPKKGSACPGSLPSSCDACTATGCFCPSCDVNATCTPGPDPTCTCKPGFQGDGHACTPVATSLLALRWEIACEQSVDAYTCSCTSPAVQSATLGGMPGAQYDVTLHFRGVVEEKTYTGGTAAGYWYTGGSPARDSWNVYRLEISDPPLSYFLNAGSSGLPYCVGLDYTRTVLVKTGATVTLTALVMDNYENKNFDSRGKPIVVPGIPPAPRPHNGQFIQMDVESVTQVP